MQNKQKQREKEGQKLAARAGLRERACQQTENLSQAELKQRMETAWRQYDQQPFKASQPTVQAPVRDREAWFVHLIPFWLKPPPGTVRQEKSLQQKVRKRIRKKQAEKQEEVAEESQQQQLVAATDETGEPEIPVQTVARSPGFLKTGSECFPQSS